MLRKEYSLPVLFVSHVKSDDSLRCEVNKTYFICFEANKYLLHIRPNIAGHPMLNLCAWQYVRGGGRNVQPSPNREEEDLRMVSS